MKNNHIHVAIFKFESNILPKKIEKIWKYEYKESIIRRRYDCTDNEQLKKVISI